jgi:hypothetical protein
MQTTNPSGVELKRFLIKGSFLRKNNFTPLGFSGAFTILIVTIISPRWGWVYAI